MTKMTKANSQAADFTQTVDIEFTISEEGRLTYRGSPNPEIIYELSCRATERANAYQRYRQSQSRQDPIALCLVGLATTALIMLIGQIMSRPAPEYTPRYQDYAPTHRIP